MPPPTTATPAPNQFNADRASVGLTPVAPTAPSQNVGSLRGNDLAGYFQSLKSMLPPPPISIASHVSNYLSGFKNLIPNIINTQSNATKAGVGAVTHGASLLSSDNPGKQALGIGEAGLGTVVPTTEAVFAPATELNKAIIPGDGFWANIARGGLMGGELGAASSIPTGGTASPLTIPVGAGIGASFAAGMYGLSKLKEVPAVKDFITAHPEVEHIVEGALTLGLIAAGSQKSDVLNTPVSDIPSNVSANVGATTGAVSNAVSGALSGAVDAVTTLPRQGLETIKNELATRNVGDQVKTSAERLATNEPDINAAIERQGIGQSKIQDPLATYDEFVNQEKAFKGDIKQDTALGQVGSRIGDAYQNVIQQRRDAGATMGSELEKVGDVPTDTAPALEKLQTSLTDQGLKYDPEDGSFSGTRTSKVTGQDLKLINNYAERLNELGDTPTVKELDAFLSKASQELDVYKNKNNITSVTNGERIIKLNLAELRDQLSPEATGNANLQDYYDAKQTYSKLSNFLDEGYKFLGKKTQSGDYEKDASLAKSSVQSILNNGKKDWLNQLEQLTGYPATDETVLALQAMKDTGNFRGLSLLETLNGGANGGSIPTSLGGVKGKIMDWVLNKGARLLTGTPEEQTRTFLSNLTSKEAGELSPQAGLSPSSNPATPDLNTQAQQLIDNPSSLQLYSGRSSGQSGYHATPDPDYAATFGKVENVPPLPKDAVVHALTPEDLALGQRQGYSNTNALAEHLMSREGYDAIVRADGDKLDVYLSPRLRPGGGLDEAGPATVPNESDNTLEKLVGEVAKHDDGHSFFDAVKDTVGHTKSQIIKFYDAVSNYMNNHMGLSIQDVSDKLMNEGKNVTDDQKMLYFGDRSQQELIDHAIKVAEASAKQRIGRPLDNK